MFLQNYFKKCILIFFGTFPYGNIRFYKVNKNLCGASFKWSPGHVPCLPYSRCTTGFYSSFHDIIPLIFPWLIPLTSPLLVLLTSSWPIPTPPHTARYHSPLPDQYHSTSLTDTTHISLTDTTPPLTDQYHSTSSWQIPLTSHWPTPRHLSLKDTTHLFMTDTTPPLPDRYYSPLPGRYHQPLTGRYHQPLTGRYHSPLRDLYHVASPWPALLTSPWPIPPTSHLPIPPNLSLADTTHLFLTYSSTLLFHPQYGSLWLSLTRILCMPSTMGQADNKMYLCACLGLWLNFWWCITDDLSSYILFLSLLLEILEINVSIRKVVSIMINISHPNILQYPTQLTLNWQVH